MTGVPRLLGTDCGTENTNLAFLQPIFVVSTKIDSVDQAVSDMESQCQTRCALYNI